MTQLLAGMDSSGRINVGNAIFIGIVICTSENLNINLKQLKNKQIELKLKTTVNRNMIANELKFNKEDSLVLCCKINRDVIINNLINTKKMRKKSPNKEKILRTFNQIFFKEIREQIIDFITRHGCDLSDIVFQCDSDCINFVKDNGLRHDQPNEVHVFSDIVAWLNNNNKEIHGIIAQDHVNKIETKMKQKLE